MQNTSTAPAHGVTVRNPIRRRRETPEREPAWEKDSTAKELVWKFGTLAPGSPSRSNSPMRPKAAAVEVKNLAYVRFEHGEAVTTRLNKLGGGITKTAQAVDPRRAVHRTHLCGQHRQGPQPKGPRRRERPGIGGPPADHQGRRPHGPCREGQQWVWEIPKIMPGERKLIEYRVTAREAKDVFALTNLSADKGIQDKAEWTTKVLVPGLTVKLTGPASNSAVNPGESARYEIMVRNTGTMPSTMVRVIGIASTTPGRRRKRRANSCATRSVGRAAARTR